MAEVEHPGPGGTATLDTSRLLLGPAGDVWIRVSGTSALQPASSEQVSALSAHFGTKWTAALLAAEALA